MDIGIFIVLLLLFLATVVVIYALFNALASGQKMVKRQEEEQREEQREEQKYFSADSMNKCAESTINLAKSKYGIICTKIIDDITLSIKKRAKEGERSALFNIREMANKYLHESCWLSPSQERELSRDFRDKYFCVIQKHFEKRGFVVSVSEIGFDYLYDTEISWK